MSENDFRGPGPKENNKEENNKPAITAIELAEHVINTTSTIIPIISSLDGDNEIKTKIIEALQKLQKLAIGYTITSAKRSQTYARRRGAAWRARRRYKF